MIFKHETGKLPFAAFEEQNQILLSNFLTFKKEKKVILYLKVDKKVASNENERSPANWPRSSPFFNPTSN